MKALKERLSELEKELTPVCKAHENDSTNAFTSAQNAVNTSRLRQR